MDKDACDSNQICNNFNGGFNCVCKLGFTLDPLANACVDINECQINNHECSEKHRCDNTIGSYNCIRLQGCGTGYTLNAQTGQCEDDDECVLKTHNCVAPYECKNTIGSFRCHKVRHHVQSFTTTKPPTTTTTQTPPPKTTIKYNYQQQYQTTKLVPIVVNPNQIHSSATVPNYQDYRYLPPCNVGMERNSQGACSGIMFFTILKEPTTMTI